MYLLRQAQLASYARLEAGLAEFGLTPTQYTVLSLANRPSPGFSSAELSRRAGVTSQTMNEVIAALERKRLIARSEAAENRRILRIGLTEAGTALLQRCDTATDLLEAEFLAGLTSAELEGMRVALAKVLHDHAVRQAKHGALPQTP